MKRLAMTFLLILAALASTADSARFYMENDFPFDEDEDYTNGARLEYQHGRYSFFIEQLMYSPEDITVPYQEGDHPYAGYLGVGGSVSLDDRITDRLFHLNYLELQTGTTGPASGAEGMQKAIHKIIGAHRPQGWDDQLKNKWQVQGLLLTGYEYVLWGRADKWNVRVSDQLGAYLGTMQIAAENKAFIKIGWGNDHDRHYSNIEVRDSRKSRLLARNPNTFYILLGNETKWWDKNIFLDGNNHHHSPSVQKEIWTTGVKAGLVVEVAMVDFGLYFYRGSMEYKTQEHAPKYVSFQMGCRF